jgi:hypothetical protein
MQTRGCDVHVLSGALNGTLSLLMWHVPVQGCACCDADTHILDFSGDGIPKW